MPRPTTPPPALAAPRLALLLALLSACSSPPPSAIAPAEAAPPPAPAARPILTEVAAVEPAGTAIPLAAEGETVVDPAAHFRVELARPCADARLLLVDGKDALVAASGTQEVGAVTRLTLTPSAPLVPAARYTLRVDGAIQRDFHDETGTAYPPVTRIILVAGEPPPPEPKEPPRGKKRRR